MRTPRLISPPKIPQEPQLVKLKAYRKQQDNIRESRSDDVATGFDLGLSVRHSDA